MYVFDARVRVRPPDPLAGRPIVLRGATFEATEGDGAPRPFPVTFERVCETLARLPRMFIEPDGALVWVGPGWQLDGALVDRDERMLYAELRGTCPSESLDELLKGLGWPATELVFELVREGVVLTEPDFRRYGERAKEPEP